MKIDLELNNWGVCVTLTFPKREKILWIEIDPNTDVILFDPILRKENQIKVLKAIRDYIGPERGWQRLIDWLPVNKSANLPLEKINKTAYKALTYLDEYLKKYKVV